MIQELSDACATFCPTVASDGDVSYHSWVAVALFLASEIMSFMDVEANGIIQAVVGMLKLKKYSYILHLMYMIHCLKVR